VTSVLIALVDVGLGVQLEEQLSQAGFSAKWDASQVDGPRAGEMPEVVLLDADALGVKLARVAAWWRSLPAVPGLLAIGSSQIACDQAPRARVTLVAPTAKPTTLARAIRDAAQLRLAATLTWEVLRTAVGLPAAKDGPAAWQPTLVAARKLAIEIPLAALRWLAQCYVTPTPRLDELREERVLSVPELEGSAVIDGTRTVQTHVRAGPLDPHATARLVWTLACCGALDVTPEVRDVATPARRLLAELRAHLRARATRLESSTYYDVLELTPLAEYEDIETAYQLLATRYSPPVLAAHDLATLATNVEPMWQLVEKARSVLVDHAQRGRYHDWLRQRIGTLRTVWAIEPARVTTAADAFARGQRALGEGDIHKAMSELAAACRAFPGQPEYEANLAWARYRVQITSGRDRHEAAVAERHAVEQLLLGCRPWPRALIALALLCVAASDADSARWYLHSALAVDPGLPAAVQLARRLGMRRS